jgi:hypothetical protein
MFDDDEKPIRYHFPEDFELDPNERVFLDKIEPARRIGFAKVKFPKTQRPLNCCAPTYVMQPSQTAARRGGL